VRNVIIWGNHSSTQYPDAHNALVKRNGQETKLANVMNDTNWLHDQFISTVQKRGAAVIAARKMSSAMSAAKAACDHMKDWWIGTADGTWVSMGIMSNGDYGAPKDIIYSFPVTIKDKQWTVVKGLDIDDFSKGKLEITGKELLEEKEEALTVCQD